MVSREGWAVALRKGLDHLKIGARAEIFVLFRSINISEKTAKFQPSPRRALSIEMAHAAA